MNLSDAARELRNKKAREYYRTHKRQYAEANRRYWEKKAAEAAAGQKDSNATNATQEDNAANE